MLLLASLHQNHHHLSDHQGLKGKRFKLLLEGFRAPKDHLLKLIQLQDWGTASAELAD